MNFNSLQEYFYKIQTVLFLLILTPLITFTTVIVQPFNNHRIIALNKTQSLVTAVAIGVASFMIYLIALIIFRKSVKKIAKQVGLSLKLERYYAATFLKYTMGAVCCLLLVAGFFLTGHFMYTVCFGLMLLLFLISWPWPSKVCRDLKLKGDEREMVFYKKHNL